LTDKKAVCSRMVRIKNETLRTLAFFALLVGLAFAIAPDRFVSQLQLVLQLPLGPNVIQFLGVGLFGTGIYILRRK